MNKNGFTLVELLAIIVIIAVVMIIAAPNISRQIKQEEEENKNVLKSKIENASKLYAAKYYANELVACDENNCDIKFTLDDLEKDGLIDLKEECKDVFDKYIKISYESGKIYYNYNEINSCYQ